MVASFLWPSLTLAHVAPEIQGGRFQLINYIFK